MKTAQGIWNEDLIWQARRGLELGRAFCRCEGHYHSLWGALRAAGVSTGLKSEEPLLASLIYPFIRDNARVMIGGSADPGVLCAVGRIYSPSRPRITVIDKCRAPLELIREFTAIKGLACRTLNLDLFDLDGSEQWDQIILHYTPDFMEPKIHGRLFRTLARSLASGGTLVCAAMTGTSVAGGYQQDAGSVFFDYSWRTLQDSPLADLAPSSEFEQMLQTYAANVGLRRLSLPTSKELRETLSAAGLRTLREATTPRKQRSVEGVTLLDSNSIVVASRD